MSRLEIMLRYRIMCQFMKVTLENDVFCGPSVVLMNVKFPRSKIKIKSKII